MALARRFIAAYEAMAAMPRRVAAIVLLVLAFASAGAGLADDRDARVLASELRIALGDLDRLGESDLPAPHRNGLTERLAGALGLLPWLLQSAGDEQGARALAEWQEKSLEPPAETKPLAALLAGLSGRHPLDLFEMEAAPIPATAMREARLIHETYCAGCHDGAGNGDPDLALPARDLYLMARSERSDIFLARLVNGIKGDETIGFRNPLDDEQLAALWKLYRSD